MNVSFTNSVTTRLLKPTAKNIFKYKNYIFGFFQTLTLN